MKCFLIGFVWAVIDLAIVAFVWAFGERMGDK